MTYRASNGMWREIVSDEQALAAWEETKPHLRGGDPQSAFILYAESELGGRIPCGSLTYIRMPAEEHPAGHATDEQRDADESPARAPGAAQY